MPTRALLAPAIAALLAAAAAPAAAQPVPPAPAGAVPARAAQLATLPAGVPVRVVAGAQRVRGRFQHVASDTLFVGVGAGEAFRAPVVRVDTLWARTGRATGRGAAIGASVGGVALGGFALFLTRALCESASCAFGRDEWTAVGVGTAVGAAGGALLGAGVGALVRTWHRVHPTP